MHEAAKLVKREELMRLLLCGHMLKECAAEMRLSYYTVRAYAKDPEFLLSLREKSSEIYKRLDAELASSKEDMRDRLERASEAALEQMIELASQSSGMLKLKALQDLLDRDTRVSRTHRVEGDMKHDFISPLFLGHAARVARELDEAAVVEPERRIKDSDERIP
jgi:hypothetical protein